MKPIVPTHEHDCDQCTFITSMSLFHRIVDIYKSCDKYGGYIIRYSSEGNDYATTHAYREDMDIAVRYESGYSENPGGTILYMNHMLCEFIEAKVKEINEARETYIFRHYGVLQCVK